MDAPQDFKWFGEGFDGFPKLLPDDTVEYIICIINSTLNATQNRERLQSFQRALSTLEKKFLKEYIWQRDSLVLDLVHEDGHWMLRGSTNYGDSVNDEWLILWLLRELSKEFTDAWIRIYDNDGEFLLIEAAHALPKWLTPEIAEHRIWINSRHLHIIPLSPNKSDLLKPLSFLEALNSLQESPEKVKEFPEIEEEAFHKLKNFPQAISENQHHAILPLPRKIAYLLHCNPSYIAPVVEAFYLRDPVSLQLLQPSKSKNPTTKLTFPPQEFVKVSVRFTRTLYAQLRSQEWQPPDVYATALASLVAKSPKDTKAREQAEIGIKLTAGVEMLSGYSIYANKRAVREIALLLGDLDAGEDSLPTDDEIAAWRKQEDDETWLDIDFTDFERELSGRGAQNDPTTGFGDKTAQENLRKMVERYKAFFEDRDAGIEGAEGLDPMDVDDDSDEGRAWDDPETDSDADSAPDLEGETDSKEAYCEDHGGKAKETKKAGVDPKSNDKPEFDEQEYKEVLEIFKNLSAADKAALEDEARKLARQQEESESDPDQAYQLSSDEEDDEGIRKLSEMMQAELMSHDALNLNPKAAPKVQSTAQKPPALSSKAKGKQKVVETESDEDDLSSDEDLDYNDVDVNLARNMLESFKSQAGTAGPAGNMFGLMGLNFPPDADEEGARRTSNKKERNNANP